MAEMQAATVPRPHTGRRRNEAVRRAIFEGALELLGEAREGVPSLEAIARRAGVGKQTIYRWWGSRAALLVEAMTEHARVQVAVPPGADVERRVEAFLQATFRNGRRRPVARALKAMMADAQHDADAAAVLSRFTAERRSALRAIFDGDRHLRRCGSRELDLITDQAFGFIWYRLLVGHADLSDDAAVMLARELVHQARRTLAHSPSRRARASSPTGRVR